ncbi:hypothetical protein YC2023_106493 [Brassica napus]
MHANCYIEVGWDGLLLSGSKDKIQISGSLASHKEKGIKNSPKLIRFKHNHKDLTVDQSGDFEAGTCIKVARVDRESQPENSPKKHRPSRRRLQQKDNITNFIFS